MMAADTLHYAGTRHFEPDFVEAEREKDLCPRCEVNYKGVESRLCQSCHMSQIRHAYCDARDVKTRARARMEWCINQRGDKMLTARYEWWKAYGEEY